MMSLWRFISIWPANCKFKKNRLVWISILVFVKRKFQALELVSPTNKKILKHTASRRLRSCSRRRWISRSDKVWAGDDEPEAGEIDPAGECISSIKALDGGSLLRIRSSGSSSARSRCRSFSIRNRSSSARSFSIRRNSDRCCSINCRWRSSFSLAAFLNCWNESSTAIGRFRFVPLVLWFGFCVKLDQELKFFNFGSLLLLLALLLLLLLLFALLLKLLLPALLEELAFFECDEVALPLLFTVDDFDRCKCSLPDGLMSVKT